MSDYSERHYLRTLLTIRRGRISLVDDSGVIQRVQLAPSGLETRDNLPRMSEYGLASNPPGGSDALIANVGGDPSNGAVVGTNHQATRPKNLAAGETQVYNGPAGTSLYLANGEIVLNANGQPVNVSGATIVTITAATEVVMDTPLLKVKGDILDNYETNAVTAKQQRADYDAHGHPVVNVQGGSSTITTGTPTVTE
ncbi:phage baseplate assembly protein V [Paraburkholderia eburnea]|uniref:Phage baseplate assembly protein V n=1 Tax=Paraburkholderia eburnea TaxID=1189126 RepID=A0A2S4MDC0_9BURK|nr:phage baseplate assembly protein V [Paraburkholderia eburnea]POR52750.1 phage baseplate assembly protein V [Paraburkholderia eburnea]PRZ23618.1 phage baseplate assembly protein V [Paraburkholderia eburnea]